jgi:DNA-binding beta-propeller fold protein YncE
MDRRGFLASLAAPLALGAVPAALARRLGGTAVALVTADTEARVVAVEVATRRVLRSIPTPPRPRSIEALSGLSTALVAHSEEGAVSLLDGRRVRLVLEGLDEPRYTAVHPLGRLAYVTDSGRGELVAIDLVRRRIVARLGLDGPARHVGVSPDGARLWTALGSKAREIAVVDLGRPERPRLQRTVVPPWRAHDVAFAPAGDTVWVTSGERREIALFAATGSTPRRVLAADAPPQHVAFRDWRPGSALAYVTSGRDGTLSTHRLVDGRRLRTAPVPRGSYNVTCSGGWVVSPSLDLGTLAVLSAAGLPVERVALAPAAHDACVLVL